MLTSIIFHIGALVINCYYFHLKVTIIEWNLSMLIRYYKCLLSKKEQQFCLFVVVGLVINILLLTTIEITMPKSDRNINDVRHTS